MKWFPLGRQAEFEAQVTWAKEEIHRCGLDANTRANSVLGMLRAAQESHGLTVRHSRDSPQSFLLQF